MLNAVRSDNGSLPLGPAVVRLTLTDPKDLKAILAALRRHVVECRLLAVRMLLSVQPRFECLAVVSFIAQGGEILPSG